MFLSTVKWCTKARLNKWCLVATCMCFTNVFAEEFQKTYPITGATAEQLIDQIERDISTPAGAFGYTQLSTGLTWQSLENADGVCSVESADFTYDITIVMPEWTDIHNAKQCLQDNWKLVWNAVQEHEEEHRRLYRLLNTDDINQRITALEPQTSCENLKASVNAEVERILNANEKLHDKFHAQSTPPTLWGC